MSKVPMTRQLKRMILILHPSRRRTLSRSESRPNNLQHPRPTWMTWAKQTVTLCRRNCHKNIRKIRIDSPKIVLLSWFMGRTAWLSSSISYSRSSPNAAQWRPSSITTLPLESNYKVLKVKSRRSWKKTKTRKNSRNGMIGISTYSSRRFRSALHRSSLCAYQRVKNLAWVSNLAQIVRC